MSLARALMLQEQSWQLQADGRLEPASAACREALGLVEAANGVNSPDVANLLNDLAGIEYDGQQFDAALSFVERARQIEETLGDRFAGADAARIRITTLSLAGEIRRHRGDYERAERDLTMALSIAIAEFGDASEEAAEARNNLGVLFKYCGRFDDGLALYAEALRAIAAAHGEASLSAAVIHHNIGGILHAAGRFSEAESPARTAWEISRHLLGDDDPRTLRDAAAYAAILDGLERYDESEPIHRHALAAFERVPGTAHEDVAATLHNLAEARAARGDFDDAERYFRRALAIKEQLFGRDSHDAALTRHGLGRLLVDAGRREEAIGLITATVDVLERRLMPDHPHRLVARSTLERLR